HPFRAVRLFRRVDDHPLWRHAGGVRQWNDTVSEHFSAGHCIDSKLSRRGESRGQPGVHFSAMPAGMFRHAALIIDRSFAYALVSTEPGAASTGHTRAVINILVRAKV